VGGVCRQMGEVQHAHVWSFRTFRMNYEYRQVDPRMETSVDALRNWSSKLDRDLLAVLDAPTDEDITDRRIIRSDFDPTYDSPRPTGQLNNDREALLIFHGKVSIHLQALAKTFPPHWQTWIGRPRAGPPV
jgi:hypothetical protein